MRLRVVAAAAFVVGFAVLSSGAPDSSPASGKELFDKRCGGCHAADRDKEGPRLRGVHSRAAASVPAFQYSDALKAAKITWTDDTLDRWLADPEKLVPNNDMAFRVAAPEDRRAIITYLKSLR